MSEQRERVVAMGDTAVPQLRALLLDGPPPEHIAVIRGTLQRLVERGTTARRLTDATIAAQLEGFRSMYRMRAASALTGIGTDGARQALCAGRDANLPDAELRAVVDSGIRRLGGACR